LNVQTSFPHSEDLAENLPRLVGYAQICPDSMLSSKEEESAVRKQLLALECEGEYELTEWRVGVSPSVSDPSRIPPDLWQAIALVATSDNVDGIAVHHISSISRSIAVWLNLFSCLEEKLFVSFEPRLTFAGSAPEFTPDLFSLFATWEKDRYQQALLAPRKSRSTGPVPYGWRRVDERNSYGYYKLEPIESEQQVLRSMNDLREVGWTYERIAVFLNQCKVATPSQTGLWSRDKVRYLYQKNKDFLASQGRL
jgi:hypothetical protein